MSDKLLEEAMSALRARSNPMLEAFKREREERALHRWVATHRRDPWELGPAVDSATVALVAFLHSPEGERLRELFWVTGERVELSERGEARAPGFSGIYVLDGSGVFLEVCDLKQWEEDSAAPRLRFPISTADAVWAMAAYQWRKPSEVVDFIREERNIIAMRVLGKRRGEHER